MTDKLVVAISSRALFDLSESHRVFEAEGEEGYARYQIAHEDDPLGGCRRPDGYSDATQMKSS